MLGSLVFAYSLHFAATLKDLTEREYVRMPPVFHLDSYERCLFADNDTGVYCHTKFDIVVDAPTALYDVIVAYSKQSETHFNHAQLSYGICLTKTCKKFYKGNTTADQRLALEACLNETLWRDYGLKARVTRKVSCDTAHQKFNIEAADIGVLMAVVVVILLNFIGSLRDFFFEKDHDINANSFMSCFSIRRNWRKVTARPTDLPDPRLVRLRSFHGIKCISVMLVITCHSMLPFIVDLDNTHYMEQAYSKWYYQLLANGGYIVQTFFVVSGFLLAYNLQLHVKTSTITWLEVPKTILLRWIRLSAPYIFVLATTATWFRFFGFGPLWQSVVMPEVESCRRDWWLHLLYVNNYIDYSYCMLHTWYIAAEFQLHILGALVLVMIPGRGRSLVLTVLFVIGVIIPAVHTYYQDLDGAMWISPETSRNMFIVNPTFNHTYKRGHTNMASFVLGLATGLAVYRWQNKDFKFNKYVRHRYLVWLTLPAAVTIILLSSALYPHGYRLSVYIRAPYAGIVRPLFGAIVAYFIVAMIFKFEDTYRGVVEWPGWAVWSRVSYSAYIVHLLLVRLLTGTRTSLLHASFLHICEILISSIVMSFVVAVPIHLLVEIPCNQLVKRYFLSSKKKENVNGKNDLETNNKGEVSNEIEQPKDEKTDSNNKVDIEINFVKGQRV